MSEMVFQEEFYLDYPVQEAWSFFTDFPAPIKVIPGVTQVRQTAPNQFQGAIKASLSLFNFLFRGEMTILKVDHHARQVVLKGTAQDSAVGGHFTGIAYTRTVPAGPNRTRVTMEVRVKLGGVMGKVGSWLLKPKAKSVVEHYAKLVSRELHLRSRELAEVAS